MASRYPAHMATDSDITSQFDRPTAAPAATAIVEVLRGAAATASWRFGDRVGRSVVRVGSGPHCSWRIDAPDVRPNHLMLVWNGDSLSAVDCGAGDVYIDDVPLCGARVLASCRVELGKAVLRVTATRASESRGQPRRVFCEAMPDAPTVAIPNAAGPDALATIAEDRPLVSGPPPDMVEPAPGKPRPLAPVGELPMMSADRPALRAPRPRTRPPAPPPSRRERRRPGGKSRQRGATPRRPQVDSETMYIQRRPRDTGLYATSIVAAAVAAIATALGLVAFF